MQKRSEEMIMAFQQQIPDEVVFHHIFYRLDIITRVRFAAVCRSWRALSREAPPPMPCLFCIDKDITTSSTLVPVPSLYKDNTTSLTLVPTLFDPISTASHNLPYPRERISRAVAGCHGPYLAYTSPATSPTWPCPPSLLYNPFSGEALQLPCMARYPDGRIERMGRLWKAQLSSTPSSGRPCLVAAVNVDFDICICWAARGQDGQGEWVVSAPVRERIHDLIFHKGELYCICDKARVFAFDLRRHLLPNSTTVLSCPTPRNVTPGRMHKHHTGREFQEYLVKYNLVESCGELLVVTQYDHWDVLVAPQISFDVHRVEDGSALVRVDDLGDTMLFVGWGCSRSWSCGSGLENQFFRKNSIYFTEFDSKPYFMLGRFCVGSSFAECLPGHLPSIFRPPWISLNYG